MELTRLTSENFELEAQVESLEKQNKKLKRQLKLYSKKLNTMECKWMRDLTINSLLVLFDAGSWAPFPTTAKYLSSSRLAVSWGRLLPNLIRHFITAELSVPGMRSSESVMSFNAPGIQVNGEDAQSVTGHPAVKHKASAISGMLKYSKGDDVKATKELILGEAIDSMIAFSQICLLRT